MNTGYIFSSESIIFVVDVFVWRVQSQMESVNSPGREVYCGAIESDANKACLEIRRILKLLQMFFTIDKEQYFDIKVILSELLQNAIKHGNDYDNNKKIDVKVWLMDNILGISVKDQGYGFDALKTMKSKSRESECDPMSMDESGRGLFIVQNLCDCMEFNASGNIITVTKKL